MIVPGFLHSKLDSKNKKPNYTETTEQYRKFQFPFDMHQMYKMQERERETDTEREIRNVLWLLTQEMDEIKTFKLKKR